MTTTKLLATILTLGLGMTANCASPPQKATSRRATPPVVVALDEMCRQIRAVAADASVCPHKRGRTITESGEWKRVLASQEGKEIKQAVAGAPREKRYAALVALAERAGQPGWHCEAFRRLGEEDPSFVRAKLDSRFVSDMDELCRILEKNSREISDPASRAYATSQEVEQRAGCAMKEMFEALAGAAPDQKYSLMRQAAAEAGRPDWQCAFLERGSDESSRE